MGKCRAFYTIACLLACLLRTPSTDQRHVKDNNISHRLTEDVPYLTLTPTRLPLLLLLLLLLSLYSLSLLSRNTLSKYSYKKL